jgi:hypothetical protein
VQVACPTDFGFAAKSSKNIIFLDYGVFCDPIPNTVAVTDKPSQSGKIYE